MNNIMDHIETRNPDQIKGVDNLSVLPVTTKDNLHSQDEDFICVSRDKIIDLTHTSGPGRPKPIINYPTPYQ